MRDDLLNLTREELRELSKDELMELGSKLCTIREGTSLSQRQIEDAVGIKHGNLSKFERGKTKPSRAALELYRQLSDGVALDDLRWNRPPKATKEGRDYPTILSEEITIIFNEARVAYGLDRQIHMRAGLKSVAGHYLGEEYDPERMFDVVHGGKLSYFQDEGTGETTGYGVAFEVPVQPHEEHFIQIRCKPDESMTDILLRRLQWYDLRRLTVKLWVPPDVADRFSVERVDGLMPGFDVDSSITKPMKPTSNGLFRAEFKEMRESWSYGARWRHD